MTSPFKRFFGGILIGIFLSLPFFLGQDHPFDSTFLAKIQAMPLANSHAFLAGSMAFLGFACAWAGAMMTRKAQPSFALSSTADTLRRRRQRQRGHRLM